MEGQKLPGPLCWLSYPPFPLQYKEQWPSLLALMWWLEMLDHFVIYSVSTWNCFSMFPWLHLGMSVILSFMLERGLILLTLLFFLPDVAVLSLFLSHALYMPIIVVYFWRWSLSHYCLGAWKALNDPSAIQNSSPHNLFTVPWTVMRTVQEPSTLNKC
jgi:hypothetical protein